MTNEQCLTVTPCPYPHWRPAFYPSCTEFVYPGCWHFDNGVTSSKIDYVLIEHGGLPQVHFDPFAELEDHLLPEHDGDKAPGAGGHNGEADQVPEDVTRQVSSPRVPRGQGGNNQARRDRQPQS